MAEPRCICDFDEECDGGGMLYCIGCGGDFCVCLACAGNGETECDGCAGCGGGDVDDFDPVEAAVGPEPEEYE